MKYQEIFRAKKSLHIFTRENNMLIFTCEDFDLKHFLTIKLALFQCWMRQSKSIFRHVKQISFSHSECFKNSQKSELSGSETKAKERPPELKKKLVQSPRAKYKFVHLMKLICKFVVNNRNAIRYCLLFLSFDPTTLIEIAVYKGKMKQNCAQKGVLELLKFLTFIISNNWPTWWWMAIDILQAARRRGEYPIHSPTLRWICF